MSLAGCRGPSGDASLVPVEGIVTLDGQPLSGADIQLVPSDETTGQGGIGRTGADGRFELTTPDRQSKGVAKGSYRVVINKLVNPDGSDFNPGEGVDPMMAAFREVLPPVYSDMEQTTLTAQVPPGGTKLEFKLVKQ